MPRLNMPSDDDSVLVANDADYKIGLEYSERLIKESLALMKRLDLPVTQLDAVSKIVIGQVGAALHARFEAAQQEKRRLVARYDELAGDIDDYVEPQTMARGRLLRVPPPRPRSPWDMTTAELKAEIEKLESATPEIKR